MTLLRIIVLSVVLVLVIIISRAVYLGSSAQSGARESASAANRHITQLSHVCHTSWQQYDWRIGEQGSLARDSVAFSDGIKRICRARAELFFEGYELSPFISPDAQHAIFPIVFIPTVEELKSVMRQNLPPLRVI